jgi:cysteine-rich repeat protein
MPSSFASSRKTSRFGRAVRLGFSIAVVAYGCAVDPDNLQPTPAGSGNEGGELSGQGGSRTVGKGGTSSGGSGSSAGSDDAGGGGIVGGGGVPSDEPAPPACGDGRKQGREACDDSNLEAGDGCDPECRVETCGNLRVDSGEECDPPAAGSCTSSCSFVRVNCGNGHVNEDAENPSHDEECDDGNDVAGDGCFDCRFECGDRRIDRAIGEDCDKGLSPDNCSDTCHWLPTCGDGEVDQASGEQCDPSNGVTCVACRIVTPPSGCAGGAGNESAGGNGGCPGTETECTPLGVAEQIQNGTFDANATGWTPHSNQVTLSLANDGDPAPKSLDVALARGEIRAQSGAYQCVPVQAHRSYSFSGRYRIPSDAPASVGASVAVVLYTGSRCQGAFVGTPGAGPLGVVRDTWTPYELTIDTSALSGEGHLLLRLDTVRPGAVTGAHVLWDSVSLTSAAGICGNCELDAGEACDDGNRASGDGCSASCGIERCGDGSQSAGEQCDDGNALFGASGDNCTPTCRMPSSCESCALASCHAELDACLGLEGEAQAGPRAGTARSTLCDELRLCAQATSCQLVRRTNVVDGAFLENCYCGTAGDDCFETGGGANGSCRAEVEAALETTKPPTLVARLSGADERYEVFAAAKDLLACELGGCSGSCVRESSCGDGYRQDRDLDLQFFVDGQYVACADHRTTTKRGCSFEECDDGNVAPGDGCDQHCLLEACGNYLVQAGEECDDGNVAPGDGCDEDCQAEYDCGNGVVESIEQCDPPGGEHDCTQAELATDPTKCACDTQCKRAVCGNGTVQKPLEECDPPDGVFCGDACKRLDQGPCETCIAANPDVAAVNDYFCTDADCIAVKQCIFDSGCFWPLGAYACYCGPDTLECHDNPRFVPVGPCKGLIGAAVGPPGLENAVVLERSTQTDNPAGRAFAVVSNAAEGGCLQECFPNAEE